MTQRFGSGGPYEKRFGYSRAVEAGGHLWVSGCTSVTDGELLGEGDAAAQARAALANALAAVERAGFTVADVVRTRVFVVDMRDGESVMAVHGEAFADGPPASTLVAVTALVDPRMLVEVEVEAYREPR